MPNEHKELKNKLRKIGFLKNSRINSFVLNVQNKLRGKINLVHKMGHWE
jgi:hypothetical protein